MNTHEKIAMAFCLSVSFGVVCNIVIRAIDGVVV